MDAKELGLVSEAWARTKKFILPDETVSLKTVFDNIRNYLMCAGVVGAVGALDSANQGQVPTALAVFAATLIAANALQSWFIVEKWTARIGRFQSEVRPGWGKFKRRSLRVLLAFVLIPVLASLFQGFGVLIQWALSGGK